MSRPLGFALAIELLVAVFVGQTGLLHRRTLDQAYSQWKQSPTPDTKLELDRQRRFSEWVRWEISLIGFAAMAGVTGVAFFVSSRLHQGRGKDRR